MFSSKSFIVSLIFRSLIHFEFIFVYGVRKCSNFILHSCPVLPAPRIEEAVFAPLYILAFFVKNKVPIGSWVYSWAFYLVPLIYISVFVPVLSWWLQLYIIIWSQKGWFLQLRAYFSRLLWLFGSFVFPYELWYFLFRFCVKCPW